MRRVIKLPLRFKILIALLLVVTIAVSIITFTMARMFHSDKTMYIHDLASLIALNSSQEARSIVNGYREKLQVFARLIYDREMKQDKKSKYVRQLFVDFHEFVAISLYEEGLDPVTIYDIKSLEEAGLTKDDFYRYHNEYPLPLEKIRTGEIFVENSSLSELLPTLTIAMAYKGTDMDEPSVIEGIIRLDALIGLAKRSKVFEVFMVDSRGNLLAHRDVKRVINRTKFDWLPDMEGLKKQLSVGTAVEYTHHGMEMIGGFSRLEFSGILVGVQIPKKAAYLTARELLNTLIIVSLILLVISAVTSLFWARRITRPIESLSEATKEIGKGHYNVNVNIKTGDEIGGLAESFSTMASELNYREQALRDAQAALVQSEKMAAFGQLGAGIAHEVKNPLAGILGFTQLSLKKLDKEDPLYENLSVIEKETKRCRTIIDNLMKFARQEKVAHELTDINTVVEDAYTILHHQLGIHQVQVEKDFSSDLPKILINSNQIQQVLMNFMINAQQAMEGNPGLIRLTTLLNEDGRVEVRVSDNGSGIPKNIQAKIFEPFFTTKQTGEGTGLGLSVSYGIIKDHKGDIKVESEPDEGTTMIISFPCPEPDDERSAANYGLP